MNTKGIYRLLSNLSERIIKAYTHQGEIWSLRNNEGWWAQKFIKYVNNFNVWVKNITNIVH